MPRLLRRDIRHDRSTRTNKPRTHPLRSDAETDSRRREQSVLRTRVWRRRYSCPFGRTQDVAPLVADLQPAADSGTGFRTGSVAASLETWASTDVRLQEGCSARRLNLLSTITTPSTAHRRRDTRQRRLPLPVAIGGATSKKRTKASNYYKGVLDQSVTQSLLHVTRSVYLPLIDKRLLITLTHVTLLFSTYLY